MARDRPELYVALREKFVESPRLGIVLDRRADPVSGEGTHDERRRLTVDEPLRTRGWARVRIDPDGRAALA